jgi:hypothetical protein
MSSSRVVLGAMLVCAMPAMALAQQRHVAPRMQQPASIQQTAFQEEGEAYSYVEDSKPPAPSPAPAAAPAAAPAPAPAAAPSPAPQPVAASDDGCSACGNCQHGCRLCRNGCLGEPWRLFPEYESGLKMGGWFSMGAYGNNHGTRSNGPIGMRDVGDAATVDQTWFYIDKPTNTKCKDWDWGFRADYVFGADGPDTRSFMNSPFGWDNGWISSDDRVYGSAIPQFYGTVAWKDLSVKMGHFFTPIGYEGVPVTSNFFYSHAYCHTFGEPFTQTGALATYQVSDNMSASAGWVTDWDTGFENPSGASMFLGGVTVPIGERMKLAWTCLGGNGGNFYGQDRGDQYLNSFVLNFEINEKWTYVLQHDLGLVTNNPGNNAQWYGLNQYLFYKLNDCWSVGGRFEWFRDDDGARVYFEDQNNTWVFGAPGDYYELTLGLNYKPHANLTIRPELRYDWFQGAAGTGAFNYGSEKTQMSGGCDLILTF